MKGIKAILGFALATTGIGGAVAVGATSLSNAENNAIQVNASTKGCLIAKLGNIGKWSQSSAKLCAYLTNDSATYWTSLQTMSSSKTVYKFDYDINFAPTKLIWVRMNPSESTGSWGEGKKWNQTGDLSFKEATYLEDQWDPTTDQCSQWTITAEVKTSLDNYQTSKATLPMSSIELVDGGVNPQVSGSVSLAKNESFKIYGGDNTISGYYGCPDDLSSNFSGGSKTGETSIAITCEFAGTYDFYYNTETKRVWITCSNIDDVQSANTWASSFINETSWICGTGAQSDDHSTDLSRIWSQASYNSAPLASSIYVRGSFNDWAANDSTKMKATSRDNVYIFVVEVAAGSEFKIALDTNWGKAYPDNNWNITTAGLKKITFDSSTKHISVDDFAFPQDSYNALSANAKTVIKTGSGNDNIKNALDRYLVIVGRYSSLNNFMNISNNSRIINPISSNNVSIILPIIVCISLSSVGMYFILRKKKHQ